MYDFQITCFVFGDLPQLINELGAVDARLAPQYRELLSGGEEDKESKKRVSVRKERASYFRPCIFEAYCSHRDVCII